MNVFLIGYRGTGKSTVARLVAQRWGRAWVDADEWLERRAGRTIREIFASDGEAVFRDLESAVVAELAARDETVIALGGGAILREPNRAAIQGRGLVVWLKALPHTLAARLQHDPSTDQRRPALTSLGGLAEIEQLLAAREPLYAQCADVVIDTEGREPSEITDMILAEIQRRAADLEAAAPSKRAGVQDEETAR